LHVLAADKKLTHLHVLSFSGPLLAMRGLSASKTRVNALVTRASIFFAEWIAGSKPANDDSRHGRKL